MAETKPSGRRRAAVAEPVMPTGEEQLRLQGRRALRAVDDQPAQSTNDNKTYAGRRFEARQRYGIAPDQAALAAQYAPMADENVVALPVSAHAEVLSNEDTMLHALRKAHKPRAALGFTHKIAAVAAVSGLALAAAAPQIEAKEEATAIDTSVATITAERTAQSVVVDVKAPGDTSNLDIQRAAVSSDRSKASIEKEKAEKEAKKQDEKLESVVAASGGDVTAAEDTGSLSRPLDSNRVTSPFGHRKNPTGAGYMIHSGQDYGVQCGTPVKASASGTVEVSGWAGHSGKRVTLSHGNGLETGYSHNSSLMVNVGDKVKRGQVIALSGTTGNSTGCHVHFEVIVNGKFQNPAGWL